MSRSSITVTVAGEGGEGVISVAEILTRTAANAGFDVYTFRTYPAEIKGGLAMMQVRVATASIDAIGRDADVLMAFNQEAFDTYGERVAADGIVLFDPKHCALPDGYSRRAIAVALHETSMQKTGGRLSKNIVALGALVRTIDIPGDRARELIESKFRRKGDEMLKKNLTAFDAGIDLADDPNLGAFALSRPDRREERRIIVSGNQAVGMGALAAGCNFVAGYPITPATPVLEFMMHYLPGMGGNVIQSEDEIASIAACMGASYGGANAMTATSGPGLCLMSELIGMASMSELPVVVVDVQRSGPGTGMPTKTGQGDLAFALNLSAGESPRIVIAPTSVEDCFHQTIRAFNLAERFQMPAILLSDQSMAYRTRTIDVPDAAAVEASSRRTAPAGKERFRRYADTETGVSPTALPGTPGNMFVASGLEHDEWGAPNYTPKNRVKMMAKRYRKLETLESELAENGDGVCENPRGAELGIVGWGSTEGPIREAIALAARDGVKVAHLQPKVLSPLPVSEVARFVKPLGKVIVLEENYTGQLANHIKAHVDVDVVRANQCTGLPFTSDDVLAALKANA